MEAFSIGDSVAVVSETISGKIIRLQFNKCVIEDTDGFERIYPLSKIVKTNSANDYNLDNDKVEKLINDKINAQLNQSEFRLNTKVSKTNFNQDILELDLHIEELVGDHSYMSNFDIIQRQMQNCRMFVEKAMRLNVKKIILIHGKGEGVLRHEIYTYLDRLENNKHIKIEFHDADFSTYGMGGATEVKFR